MKPIFPRELFLKKIKLLMTENNLDRPAAFDEKAGLFNWLGRFRSNEGQKVEIETLLAIADNFKVSLDWLLGRENLLFFQEHVDLPYQARTPISQDIRRQIKLRLRQYLLQQKETLPTEFEVNLEDLAEEYYREYLEMPDDQVIKALLPACRRPL